MSGVHERVQFDPVLCQTCGMPYGIEGAPGCEAHLEAECEGFQQDIPAVLHHAYMKGALSILTAMRGWCIYDVDPDFDEALQAQIREYEGALGVRV